MKKFLTLAVVALASVFGASAGNLYLGGNVGYIHESKDGVSTNNFSILPELGYNFNKSWAIGTTIGYDVTAYCDTGVAYNSFDFNPYARWTFFRTSNNLVNLFVDGTLGIGLGWVTSDGDSNSAITYQIGFKPGIAINLTDRFSLVAHLGLLGYRGCDDNAYEAHNARYGGLNLNGNNVNFGFYYNF